MTEYNKQDLISDFASRTQKNLEVIEEIALRESDAQEPKAFEVTQLINSMLGLLVFPQQGWYERLPNTPLSDLEAQGWPKINFKTNTVHCQTLDQLARYLRNAVGHFNLDVSVLEGEIAGIRLWNHEGGNRNRPINVEVEMTIDEVREFTLRFVGIFGNSEQNS